MITDPLARPVRYAVAAMLLPLIVITLRPAAVLPSLALGPIIAQAQPTAIITATPALPTPQPPTPQIITMMVIATPTAMTITEPAEPPMEAPAGAAITPAIDPAEIPPPFSTLIPTLAPSAEAHEVAPGAEHGARPAGRLGPPADQGPNSAGPGGPPPTPQMDQ